LGETWGGPPFFLPESIFFKGKILIWGGGLNFFNGVFLLWGLNHWKPLFLGNGQKKGGAKGGFFSIGEKGGGKKLGGFYKKRGPK